MGLTPTVAEDGIPLSDIDLFLHSVDKEGRPYIRLYTKCARNGTRYFPDTRTQAEMWEWIREHSITENFIWRPFCYFSKVALITLRPIIHPEVGPSLLFTFRNGVEYTQPFHDEADIALEHAEIARQLEHAHEAALVGSNSPQTLH